MNLSDTIERKFVESIETPPWLEVKVLSENGYVPVTHSNKTIEYDVFKITLENNLELECADTHIIIDEFNNEIFAKDSKNNNIKTKNGMSKVISVENLHKSENMYDLTVDSEEHTYYTNDILSHNTTTVAAYILYCITFTSNYTCAILANKAAISREILARVKLMYEFLPDWIKQGVKKWNEGSIEFENGSKAFSAATTKSGLRGKSCVTSDTKICILSCDEDIYYTEIEKIINNSKFVYIENEMDYKYIVYKTTNKINGMYYVGFHKTRDLDDGYMGSGIYLRRAIEKYGIENFEREILHIYSTQDEAEQKEAEIVNKDFTLREDTYNINIGGNVRIAYGKNNGFYGKKHKKETIEKIQQSRNNFDGKVECQTLIKNLENGEIYRGYEEALNKLGFIKDETFPYQSYGMSQQRIFLANLLINQQIEFSNINLQEKLIKNYNYYIEKIEQFPEILNEFKRKTSKRFKGIKHSEERIRQRVDARKKWIKDNPDLFKQTMDKINKNPEKIEKTAAKHRGMKRSDETKRNISESLKGKPSGTKNKIKYHNPETNKNIYLNVDDIIPSGFVKGNNPKDNEIKRGILYNNGLEQKLFKDANIPEGWVKGGLPKPRKNKNSN